jgi:radical SAM protein
MRADTSQPSSPGVGFERAPFIVFWETTRACDLVCRHCRAQAVSERHSGELSNEEGFALLTRIRELGCPVVVLTGGDPAKRPDLVDLVRHGTAIGLRMALTPSATPLITPDLLGRLRGAGLARLAISLDGASPRSHDAFRGVPGSYQRTFSILRCAAELGLTTQVNTSVNPANAAELEEIAGQVAQLGVELWSVFVVVPTGRAAGAAGFDAAAVEQLLERLADIAAAAAFDVKTTAAPHFRRVLLQRKLPRRDVRGIADGIGRAPRGVNDGQGILFVSHLGDIYPSGFLPIRCGNVRGDDLASVYRDHEVFRRLRDPEQLLGKCGVCEFRRVCGGSRARAFALSGDALAEDPLCAYTPRAWPSPQARTDSYSEGSNVRVLRTYSQAKPG